MQLVERPAARRRCPRGRSSSGSKRALDDARARRARPTGATPPSSASASGVEPDRQARRPFRRRAGARADAAIRRRSRGRASPARRRRRRAGAGPAARPTRRARSRSACRGARRRRRAPAARRRCAGRARRGDRRRRARRRRGRRGRRRATSHGWSVTTRNCTSGDPPGGAGRRWARRRRWWAGTCGECTPRARRGRRPRGRLTGRGRRRPRAAGSAESRARRPAAARLLDRDHRLVEPALGDVGHDHDQRPRVSAAAASRASCSRRTRPDAVGDRCRSTSAEASYSAPERRVVGARCGRSTRQGRDVALFASRSRSASASSSASSRRSSRASASWYWPAPGRGDRRRAPLVVPREERVDSRAAASAAARQPAPTRAPGRRSRRAGSSSRAWRALDSGERRTRSPAPNPRPAERVPRARRSARPIAELEPARGDRPVEQVDVAADDRRQRVAPWTPEVVDQRRARRARSVASSSLAATRLVAGPVSSGRGRRSRQVVHRRDEPGAPERDQRRDGEPDDRRARSRSSGGRRGRADHARIMPRPAAPGPGAFAGGGEAALHRPRLEPELPADAVERADVVELELAQLVGRDRERQAERLGRPATRRISGSGIGRSARRFPIPRRTSSTISRYVQ